MLLWQERVVAERDELKEKLQKLADFLDSPAWYVLDGTNQRLLEAQASAMSTYLSILNLRISAFKE